jgi:hypothetical protein
MSRRSKAPDMNWSMPKCRASAAAGRWDGDERHLHRACRALRARRPRRLDGSDRASRRTPARPPDASGVPQPAADPVSGLSRFQRRTHRGLGAPIYAHEIRGEARAYQRHNHRCFETTRTVNPATQTRHRTARACTVLRVLLISEPYRILASASTSSRFLRNTESCKSFCTSRTTRHANDGVAVTFSYR